MSSAGTHMPRELILLSPYTPPTQHALMLGAEDTGAWLNGWSALWHPAAVAWGVVAGYLLVAVELTSLARNRISKRTWRRVHTASFVLFVFATVHGLTAGTVGHRVLKQGPNDPFPPPGRFPGSVRHARQALGGMRSAQDL